MTVTINTDLRIEPPRCTITHGSRAARRACELHKARERYVQAHRRDRIRSGEHRPGETRPLKPVQKESRCRTHRGEPVRGCDDCKAWWRYQSALRRRAEAAGTLQRRVPAAVVRTHLEKLLDPETGGWHRKEIAAVSGVGHSTIRAFVNGRQGATIYPDTWNALKALQPKGVPRVTRAMNQVDRTEAQRIIRGLVAQGFSFRHLSQMLSHRHAADQVAYPRGRKCITIRCRDQVRALRAALERYDVETMVVPLPGMSRKTAERARAAGWVKLAAWQGLDIADPSVSPRTEAPAPVDDDLTDEPEPDPGFGFVDPVIVLRCQAAMDVVRDTTTADNKRCQGYVTPLGHIRRFEAFCAVGYATEIGLSTTETGLLLGYPGNTIKELAGAERSASRMRAVMSRSRRRLDQMVAGDTPDPQWCRPKANGNGFNDADELVTALLALQPAPFGPGWAVDELAARAGVDEGEMRGFLAYATRRMDRPWEAEVKTRARAAGQPVQACTRRAA
jgi:hypothetical protein